MGKRLPDWFKQRIPRVDEIADVSYVLRDLKLNTVCQSALCPNMCQCFAKKTATFMIMGDVCTRNCTFCAITKGKPSPLDNGEPERIATAVKRLGLEYVVITSVTRDDLDDGGASHFARTIETVRLVCPGTKVEVLIPDFQGLDAAIETVINAKPSVINHNIETVPRLYSQVRPLAGYRRSLDLLSSIKKIDPGMVTKSGLMLGLGEKREEVIEVMKELRKAGCNLITLGQYLAPSSQHHPVINYVTPKEFSGYIQPALEMGFSGIASAPLVRSSYKAAELYQQGRPCA
ncbi:MAG: lipoyl synthase [Dehalococcoidales bacterium]|nr:lipoyl synthase [Dehalococcoidales bacterium]MDD3264371.1 lipoyl synthase [Dehalococcoidales bacterium]MDD4322137.1 lipoyl synthase [Dehalococcoidales bacterium]MDD4793707.1 lipoyl synthase [Dehalococcoidales bacterium]MDD5497960.1 lipoyl synthase [Dehalococcoidales bacterium]